MLGMGAESAMHHCLVWNGRASHRQLWRIPVGSSGGFMVGWMRFCHHGLNWVNSWHNRKCWMLRESDAATWRMGMNFTGIVSLVELLERWKGKSLSMYHKNNSVNVSWLLMKLYCRKNILPTIIVACNKASWNRRRRGAHGCDARSVSPRSDWQNWYGFPYPYPKA